MKGFMRDKTAGESDNDGGLALDRLNFVPSPTMLKSNVVDLVVVDSLCNLVPER